jgi:hypothetical protein
VVHADYSLLVCNHNGPGAIFIEISVSAPQKGEAIFIKKSIMLVSAESDAFEL